MATTYPTPPTFALPVIVNAQSGDNQFNPIWLQWFLQLAQFLSSTTAGRLRDFIPVLSPGTYVPSNGTNNVLVMAWGAGGGGGPAAVTGVGQVSVGGGGGAGAFAMQLLTTAFTGLVFTPGAGGGSGSNGGDTTFGTLTAGGGKAGVAGPVATAPTMTLGGAGGSGNGIGVFHAPAGLSGFSTAANFLISGQGASSSLGQGGLPVTSGAGQDAVGYAAGGSGGASLAGTGPFAGGKGAPGFGLVMELS